MTADDRLRLIRIKIERAYKHIEDLEVVVRSFNGPVFKTLTYERDSYASRPSLQSDTLHIYNARIPAITGDAVHNLRSALDHLAFQLVDVGVASGVPRVERWDTIQFPIAHDAKTYESRKLRYIEGARREAIEAIDRLNPYKGGNDALWFLYKLDIADKHSVIIVVGEDVIMDGISLKVNQPFFTNFYAPDHEDDVQLAISKPFAQPSVAGSNALIPTLHQLAEIISDIVDGFHAFLQ